MTAFKSALELSALLQSGDLKSTELVQSCFSQIREQDSHLKAYVSLMEDAALDQADEIDKKRANGERLPLLAGIPIAIKDNINITGTRTTCSSKMLENYVSPYNATVISKLHSQGLIPIGKTNMDEFAMGSSTENSAFFTTLNPWNKACIPGGSSGGSAATVSARQVPLSLGSDTGGSIRQPASFCGIVGLKPTYGRVSRFGLVAFASSLDQIGPFATTVEDTAALLTVICGKDELDSTSAPVSTPDFLTSLKTPSKRPFHVGVPRELMGKEMSPEVVQSTRQALNLLKEKGIITWEEIDLKSLDTCVAIYYIIAPAECSANLSRFDGVRYGHRAKGTDSLRDMYIRSRTEGFGEEVKRRIILGTYALSSGYYDAYYLKAQKMRTIIRQEFNDAFKRFDVIATPSTPTPAFKLTEHASNPTTMYVSDIATIAANMTGLPAMSIPCGFSESGLPLGLQLIGKAFDEETILQLGYQFQSLTDYHQQVPKGVCS